jgi:hypothetical protein
MCKLPKIFLSHEGRDIAIGICLGLIVAIAATEFSAFIHRQPDFYIVGPTFILDEGGNGSIKVAIHNLYEGILGPKYGYSIMLVGYEIGLNGSPKYFNQTSEGIMVEPSFLNWSLYINDQASATANMNYAIGTRVAKGDHLMEIKAMGGDGKERKYHFNLKTKSVMNK